MLARIAAALICAGFLAQPSFAQTPHTHEHRFSGAEKWSKVFDDPARDAWQKPHEVIQALALAPDSVVADIGSGTGYFAVRLAHFVPKGRVYGVDSEPDMVKFLAERARREGLANITSIAAKPDNPQLPVKVDLILLVDVYHHIAEREKYFHKLRDSLKPRGRIAIIDFTGNSPIGPPARERIPAERVQAELKSAGYFPAKEHAFLPNQFFIVFEAVRH